MAETTPATEALDPQRNITAYWDRRGSSYDAQPGHGLRTQTERDAWHNALRALLPPAPADVVDVGCGTGFLSLLLAELGHRVAGFDLAEGMLAEARTKASGLATPPRFEIGDAVDPPVPPSSVDVLASRHVLWTLRDLGGAAARWRQALRPGGRVVAIDGLWWADRSVEAMAQPDPESWQARMMAYYTDEVKQHLPLMSAGTLDPVLDVFRAAGFGDVQVSNLAEVERVEREHNPDQERFSPRYVVTAIRPS